MGRSESCLGPRPPSIMFLPEAGTSRSTVSHFTSLTGAPRPPHPPLSLFPRFARPPPPPPRHFYFADRLRRTHGCRKQGDRIGPDHDGDLIRFVPPFLVSLEHLRAGLLGPH